jgi:enediyne core biosynthesis thioesterase
MRYYEYRHRVGFEETNLVGNVYYVNHLRWQGRCREMFLLEHAPEILDDLARGLALATVRCSCDYLAELRPFDEVALRMRLAAVAQNRITLHFEYWRCSAGSAELAGGEELVARGEQQVACMRREGDSTVPVAIPAALREALRPYAGPEIVL